MSVYEEKETSWVIGIFRRTKMKRVKPSWDASLRHLICGSNDFGGKHNRSLKPRKRKREYNW